MVADLSQVTEDSARGGFFLFSGATLASIILAVSAILMGRFLGADLYGQYNLVVVIPSLLILLTDLGLNAGVTKFVTSLHAEGKTNHIPLIIKHSLFFRLGVGIIVSILSILFASYFALIINRPELSLLIQVASLSVVFQVIFTTCNSAFVGLDKSEYSALNSTIRAEITTILQITLVYNSFGVVGAIVCYFCGFVVSAVFGGILLSFKFLKPKYASIQSPETGIKHNLSFLMRYGLPVYVSVVLIGFFPLYQQMVLSFFVSDAVIGNFRAAFNFVILLTIISTSLTTALLPAFSKLEFASPELISAFFNKANKYASLVVVPISIFVIIFSGPIVNLLYGSTYTSAALFLSLSCSVFLLSIIGSLTLQSVFNGLGKTRFTMNMTLINFIVLILLTPVFALFFSIIGVIAASLLATTISSIYALIVAIHYIGVRFSFKSTLLIYLISLLSCFPLLFLLFFTSLNSTIILIVGGFMYLFALVILIPLMKTVNKVELETLARLASKLPLLNIFAKPLFVFQNKILLLIDKS